MNVQVIVIEIENREKKILEKCLERVYFKRHGLKILLGDSDPIVIKMEKEKQQLLKKFEIIIHATYLKIGITGKMVLISTKEATLLATGDAFLLTGGSFLAAKFLEE